MNIFAGLPEGALTRDEERDIVALKTDAALEKLVLHTIKESVIYSRRVCRGRFEDGELMSICWDALRRAAKNFDPARQRFFAYAKPYVRGAINREWASRDVVKNSSLHETEVELRPVKPTSLDRPDGEYEPDQIPENLRFERLEPDSVDPDFKGIDIREHWAVIAPLLAECLSDRERMTIELHYMSGFTFTKIGSLLNRTKQGVQAIHVRALKKLRCRLERNARLLREKTQ